MWRKPLAITLGKPIRPRHTHKERQFAALRWTGKFDGEDYAVTGDPKSDMRSYKKISDHTLAFTAKKDGKTTSTGRIVVAADGKVSHGNRARS